MEQYIKAYRPLPLFKIQVRTDVYQHLILNQMLEGYHNLQDFDPFRGWSRLNSLQLSLLYNICTFKPVPQHQSP